MANEVRLTLAGDSQQLERAFERAAASATEAGQEVQDASKRFEQIAETWDNAETRAQGFRDGVTGVQDSMASLSALAQGDFQNGLLLAGSGIADLSSSLANTLIPWAEKTVTSLGALRLSLIGIGGAAAIAAIVFIKMANDANRFEADLTHAQEDLQRFIETGRRTVFIRDVFGDLNKSTSEWADLIHKAQVDWNKGNLWSSDTWDVISGKAHAARQRFEAMDQAIADFIDRTGEAELAVQILREEMGGQNYEAAVQAGLLDKTQDALARNTERQWDQAEAVKGVADAYREAVQRMTTFAEILMGQTNPIFAVVNAERRLRDAQNAEAEAIKKYGKGSAEATDAAWDRYAAELALIDATARAAAVNQDELIPILQQLQREGLLSADAFAAIAEKAGLTHDQVQKLMGVHAKITVDLLFRVIQENLPLRAPLTLAGAFIEGGPGGLIRALTSFHDGGIVPGPAGQEVLAVLQAGERVIPLGGDPGQTVTIVINSGGSRVDDALAWVLARSIQVAGGNVQTALGW